MQSTQEKKVHPQSRLGLVVTPEDLFIEYEGKVELRGYRIVDEKDVMSKCIRVAKWLGSSDAKKSLLLYGSVGNGKTTMMDAIVELYRRYKLQIISIHAKRLNECILEDNDAFRLYCSYPCLAIDDLGTQQPFILDYGNRRDPFCELIEERYRRNLRTFISTNLNISKIEELYGIRTSDRMTEMFDKLYYNEQSYRK